MKAAREAKGLSRRAFAGQVFMSHSNLADYEHGRRLPPASVLQAYERELNLPARALMDQLEQARSQLSQPGAGPVERPRLKAGGSPQERRWPHRWHLKGVGIALATVVTAVGTIVLALAGGGGKSTNGGDASSSTSTQVTLASWAQQANMICALAVDAYKALGPRDFASQLQEVIGEHQGETAASTSSSSRTLGSDSHGLSRARSART